mmetsp:Transcript_12962/g.29362  ORF Transcript_12962/g.29362 Transcript_12962/m.29362 type:complete len:257 (+) Transcript_12962:487-1257(+)
MLRFESKIQLAFVPLLHRRGQVGIFGRQEEDGPAQVAQIGVQLSSNFGVLHLDHHGFIVGGESRQVGLRNRRGAERFGTEPREHVVHGSVSVGLLDDAGNFRIRLGRHAVLQDAERRHDGVGQNALTDRGQDLTNFGGNSAQFQNERHELIGRPMIVGIQFGFVLCRVQAGLAKHFEILVLEVNGGHALPKGNGATKGHAGAVQNAKGDSDKEQKSRRAPKEVAFPGSATNAHCRGGGGVTGRGQGSGGLQRCRRR